MGAWRFRCLWVWLLWLVEMAQFGPATGIDLGTASCTVAVAGNKGVDIICNEVSNRETPTIIAFDDDVRCIGESAVNEASRNPQRAVTALKRLVGRKIDEEARGLQACCRPR